MAKPTTITISRQMGSGGCEVAQELASRLGYRLVWRELINQAAQRAGAPEMALATIDELGLLGLRPSASARRAYLEAVKGVMEELAAEGGVVIVGRAGQAILRERPDVLHVRVIAPQAVRVARLARERRLSEEAALAQITTSDNRRRAYLRRYYQVSWDAPALYDLVLNTARLSPSQAAEVVVQTLTCWEGA